MNWTDFNEEQVERIQRAKKTGKYGHLGTWKELTFFSMYIGTTKQSKEIGQWAARQNRYKDVTLPLISMTKGGEIKNAE